MTIYLENFKEVKNKIQKIKNCDVTEWKQVTFSKNESNNSYYLVTFKNQKRKYVSCNLSHSEMIAINHFI